jgi:hypothetical protein
MPSVITPDDFILNKQSLSLEGFFVDTQIIIYYQDPFGKSAFENLKVRYEEVQASIHKLKSSSLKAYSTIPVLFEYYKHIQINSYMLYLEKSKFDDRDFKNQKKNNFDFALQWESQMKLFKKTFLRTFPIYDFNINGNDLLNNFDFMNLDFGDHFLVYIVQNADKRLKAIFSNDSDFYSIPDDNFLITTNPAVIKQSKQEGKYYKAI